MSADKDIISNGDFVLSDDIIYTIIKLLEIDGVNWLFVNKHWSKVTASFLWKNPFRFCKTGKGFHLIRTYITCFNKEERVELDSLFEGNSRINKGNSDINKRAVHDYYPKPFYEYGKYLNEFKPRELNKLTFEWFKVMVHQDSYRYYMYRQFARFELFFLRSIMKHCQRLDCMDWNLLIADKCLLETMQSKIMNLKNLSLNYNDNGNTYNDNTKNNSNDDITKVINNFKNYSQNLTVLKYECSRTTRRWWGKNERDRYASCMDLIAKELTSLVESQHGIKNFIVNYKCDENISFISFTLQSQANSLTKVVLGDVDFNRISFDSLEKCENLESLALKFSKGLKLENIDHYTTFKNLKILELNLNEWLPEVTALIIRKAGNNLTTLTIGEVDHTINDDTLITLTECCPKINSLSISQMSTKSFKKLFSHIKDLKLNTLNIYQIEGTIIKSKSLLQYIDHNSLTELGIKRKDDYWNVYNCHRDNFKNLLKKHNTRSVLYVPFSCIEIKKIAGNDRNDNHRNDDDMDDDDDRNDDDRNDDDMDEMMIIDDRNDDNRNGDRNDDD